MKIVLPGGSGQVGQLLARAFTSKGHDVVVLSRAAGSAAARVVPWDARTVGEWAREVDGADVVINLAGRSVNCRYTAANLRAMMDSRIESTRAVGLAIARARRPPSVWLQMSTATIYAHTHDEAHDEQSGVIGGNEEGVPTYWGYSVEIAKRWEDTQREADTPATRKVALRTAMVMSADRGGIFDVLLGLVRRGLGGPVAGGRQYVSWIHGDDFVRAIHHLIDSAAVVGPVNLAAPGPLPYRDFMRGLREASGVRLGLPASRFMLELGAFFLRTDTELVLKSRRVVPGRLLAHGFSFEHPDWPSAARDLVRAWRLRQAS